MPTKARKFRRRFGSPAAGIEEQNRRAADIILANGNPGDDGLAVQWARGILGKQPVNAPPTEAVRPATRRRMIDGR
jgi:hypothetical protein